jgi:hypothetical protein
VYLTNIIGRFLVRFESRIFSPYLIVVAKNKKNIKDTKAK